MTSSMEITSSTKCDKTNKWIYQCRMGAGYSLRGYSCGSYTLMGFKGVATYASVADVVIYFFK